MFCTTRPPPPTTHTHTHTHTQCNRTDALGAFFPQVIEEPLKVAIVGSGCSLATEPTAEVSRYYNLTQVRYINLEEPLIQHSVCVACKFYIDNGRLGLLDLLCKLNVGVYTEMWVVCLRVCIVSSIFGNSDHHNVFSCLSNCIVTTYC